MFLNTTNLIKLSFQLLLNWFVTTDHKKIGVMYIILGFLFGFIGLWLSAFVRLELINPGNQLYSGSANSYQISISFHGIIMIFFAVMPILISGFGNYLIPLAIGTRELAYPRLNNVSLLLFFNSFLVLIISTGFFGNDTGFYSGWTLYPPLSIFVDNPSIDFLIISLHLNGLSSLLNAINTIITIQFNSSLPLWNTNCFVWSLLFTSYLLVLVIPVLVVGITTLLTDHILSTCFFSAAAGGDPVLFQHLFWFFGHPEVYILILPVFGLVSDLICYYSNKKLFGKNAMFWSMFSISVLGLLVWGHHMFTAGLEMDTKCYFMIATMLISIPTGLKVFSWLLTLVQNEIRFSTSISFITIFIITFTFGGVSGVILSQAGIDIYLHDTYYVVGHFHYVLALSIGYTVFASVYHWYTSFTGLFYNVLFSKVHLYTFTIGSNLLFFPMHFLGISGMQRRVMDYPSCFQFWHFLSTCGAILVFFSILWFLLALISNNIQLKNLFTQ